MIRDLNWNIGTQGKQMGGRLVTPERNAELERYIAGMIERGVSLQSMFDALNERGDLTDGEWTVCAFNLGYFNGLRDA